MLAMALLVALATPSGPIPRVLVRSPADCAALHELPAGQSLHFTHETYAQSCAPGGPCSVLSRTPQPVDGFVIKARGCDRAVKGRIVKTGKICDGLPLWRFSGTLRSGHQYRVGPAENPRGQVQAVGGTPRPLKCGAEWLPAVRTESVSLTRQPEMVVVRMAELNLRPTEDGKGSRLDWAGPADMPFAEPAPRIMPSTPVDAAFAGATAGSGGFRATQLVRGAVTQIETTTREGITCKRITRGEAVLRFDGSALYLDGSYNETDESKGPCPPLPKPPVDDQSAASDGTGATARPGR